METPKLVWRPWAKTVAIVEIVILSMDIFLVLCVTYLGYIGYTRRDSVDPDKQQMAHWMDEMESKHVVPGLVLLLLFSLVAFIIGTQMLAAIRLLSASEKGRDPRQALAHTKTWRTITYIFLIIGIIGCLGSSAMRTLLITLLWRGGAIVVVNNFMKELNVVIASQPECTYYIPEVITVKNKN